MTTKTAKKMNSSKTVANLRKAQASGPSLKDLVSGKGDAVARATAAHAQEKLAAEKKAAPKGKATKPAAKKSERKPGSGALIRSMLMKGAATDVILAAVHKAFPGHTTKASDVAWNKWDMKRKGEKVPEQAKSARKTED